MLKLLVYAKIDHIESTRVIEEMAKFHDYLYILFVIELLLTNVQFRGIVNDLGDLYYEILLQMTLEKAVKKRIHAI